MIGQAGVDLEILEHRQHISIDVRDRIVNFTLGCLAR